VTIDVKLVDVVPAEASGKFRYVVSRVGLIFVAHWLVDLMNVWSDVSA
jgi:hypothetical protein